MVIYQGIQLVYSHVVNLINAIGVWFSDIEWSELIQVYPLQFQAPIMACLVILLVMSSVGLVKKMSFLLG